MSHFFHVHYNRTLDPVGIRTRNHQLSNLAGSCRLNHHLHTTARSFNKRSGMINRRGNVLRILV
jgi:hypothetical protein